MSGKKIWMCWFQGEKDPAIPELNQQCITKWRQLNPTLDVNVLDIECIQDYVPDFFDIVAQSPKRSWQAKSDLLRVLLLSKYGGTWVDASVFPMQGLSSFYDKIVNETGFFAYRFFPRKLSPNGGYAETASWFMCADYANHPLIDKLKAAFIKRFKFDKQWQYLTFHDTLCNLYDADPEINFIINNMIQIDMKIPCSALHKGWDARVESFLYKRPW
jgi:hypothetical protein